MPEKCLFRSIRASFGTNSSQNAVHGSDSPESAIREIHLVFGESVPRTSKINVKPRPPATAKPSSAAPPRTASAANLKRSTPSLNRGVSERSLAAGTSSRAASSTTLANARKAGAPSSKPTSRAASLKELNADNKKISRSRATFGLKSSTTGLNPAANDKTQSQPRLDQGVEDKGGEKGAPPRAYEVPGHTEMAKQEGMDKVPSTGNTGPGIAEDPTNATIEE